MSTYAELWTALKKSGELSIQVSKDQHKRCMRMLRHESHKDSAYRLSCVEEGKAFAFRHASMGSLLVIRLIYKNTIPKGFLITYKRRK